MNSIEPLAISSSTLANIKFIARRAQTSIHSEADLRRRIAGLPPDEKRDLLALFILGRPGTKKFTVARRAAAHHNLDHVADYLADTPMFLESLNEGLRRYKKQV